MESHEEEQENRLKKKEGKEKNPRTVGSGRASHSQQRE